MSRIFKTAGWFTLYAIVITGCSGIEEYDTRIQYKKSTTTSPLELPPDLMATTAIEDKLNIPDTTTYSDYQTGQEHHSVQEPTNQGVLPLSDNVQLQHRDQLRWLTIQNTPEAIWSKVKNFLLDEGFNLSLENPQIGIIETDWAENRADIPQDGLRKLLGGALDFLYSAPTRDKYRIRLERGQAANTTEVYLTHRGMKEVSHSSDTFVWEDRPTDPELEAEMLNRLMVYLGVNPKQADTQVATTTTTQTTEITAEKAQLFHLEDGQMSILVEAESYDRVWRYVGLALDRIGLSVEDRDQAKGVYFVRYLDLEKEKSGVFDGWFGDDENNPDREYQIHLTKEQENTRIIVLDKEGKVDTSKSAQEILKLLHEQLSQSTPVSKH